MRSMQRPDDYVARRQRLQTMTDQELHEHFWGLVDRIIAPLIDEARTHTSPSIERSVLLRMGFSSVEAGQLVEKMRQRDLLGHGAGRLVLELAKRKNISLREAGTKLLENVYWDELPL